MGIGSGLSGQLAIGKETVWGTPVAPTDHLPFSNEDLKREISRIESAALTAPGVRGRRATHRRPGGWTVGGDISMDAHTIGCELLYEAILGEVASATTAAGGIGNNTAGTERTYTPGDSLPSFTGQVGRPNTAGVVGAWTYAGLMAASWEFALKTEENVTFAVTWVGKDEIMPGDPGAPTLAASAVPAAAIPLSYLDVTMKIGAVAQCIREITIGGENGLGSDDRCLGSGSIDKPILNDRLVVSGSIDKRYIDDTFYDLFVSGATTALAIQMSSPTGHLVELDLNVQFDGETPSVSGTDVLTSNLPFTAVAVTDDASMVKLTSFIPD